MPSFGDYSMIVGLVVAGLACILGLNHINKKISKEEGQVALSHHMPPDKLKKLTVFEITHFLESMYSIVGKELGIKPSYPRDISISKKHLLTNIDWKIR